MTDDTAALKEQVAAMAKLLAAHGITEQAATRTRPVKRVVFEQVYSGPSRNHDAALKALTHAGLEVKPSGALRDGAGGDSHLTVTSTWDGDGAPDDGFQQDRIRKTAEHLEPYGYTLQTHGVVGGWGQPT